MRNKWIFALAAVGLALGLMGAWYFAVRQPAQPPAFNPARNPFAHGIYANGIVESAQGSAENVNLLPEVAGTVTKVRVAEGDRVKAGAELVTLDVSVQQASTASLKAQAEAAGSLLEELRKQPRPEALEVARAQVAAAEAGLRQAVDSLQKQRQSYETDPRSVSKDVLDTAENAARVAAANLEVARRQFELTRAGAWQYDIRNQERIHESLERQYQAANALLEKYTLRAPVDGVVLAVYTVAGAYVSAQGAYDTYTQSNTPVVVMSTDQLSLGVRVYVD